MYNNKLTSFFYFLCNHTEIVILHDNLQAAWHRALREMLTAHNIDKKYIQLVVHTYKQMRKYVKLMIYLIMSL